MNYLLKIGTWLSEAVFPIRCLGCRVYTDKQDLPYLCPDCAKAVTIRTSSECIGCKRSVPHGLTCVLCRPDYRVDQLLVALDYKEPTVQRMIRGLKYSYVPAIAQTLAWLTERYLLKLAKSKDQNPFRSQPLIVPVPLHFRRLNWRGFNQSTLLVHLIASYFQHLAFDDLLARTRYTLPQAKEDSRQSRSANVAGAFLVTQPTAIAGRHVLLIDDICTTGVTLNECAKVLKSAGAISVTALVIARG